MFVAATMGFRGTGYDAEAMDIEAAEPFTPFCPRFAAIGAEAHSINLNAGVERLVILSINDECRHARDDRDAFAFLR